MCVISKTASRCRHLTTELLTILKGHYEEEHTDLHQRRRRISQEQKENAKNFLFRAIELKACYNEPQEQDSPV